MSSFSNVCIACRVAIYLNPAPEARLLLVFVLYGEYLNLKTAFGIHLEIGLQQYAGHTMFMDKVAGSPYKMQTGEIQSSWKQLFVFKASQCQTALPEYISLTPANIRKSGQAPLIVALGRLALHTRCACLKTPPKNSEFPCKLCSSVN